MHRLDGNLKKSASSNINGKWIQLETGCSVETITKLLILVTVKKRVVKREKESVPKMVIGFLRLFYLENVTFLRFCCLSFQDRRVDSRKLLRI